MNSYITKPFDEDELLKVIYKNIKMQNTLETNDSGAEKTLYDLKNIQALSRGNEDFIQKCFPYSLLRRSRRFLW
jgi:FixJ family two-component response regulator